MDFEEIGDFLNEKADEYNVPGFIPDDPISVPHQFTKKQDIEIAGFFAAIMAWGQRKTIISKSMELMERMDNEPYEFVLHHSEEELRNLEGFVHRTFNFTDLLYFIAFFRHHYNHHDSLEDAFLPAADMEVSLSRFHDYFFSLPDFPVRTRKHIATPARKSACKRINMFLRWMVRKDNRGVDFGLWNRIEASELICPCDVHVERVARRLGLIQRRQVDWQTAMELTEALRQFDPHDPVRFDFALFGLGIEEKKDIWSVR
ncbi:TIGR02757 family protein [Fulvivirga sedimenti]|uniref:TIGR02757 family protein n=1 Tax=Fulvivirga sedimenti TaxID=2879465 RepID=A0A9X1HPN0_9BACT|nr:TIGR02757 family protein [Fulvivirga sedimenti]MCA6073897.1 TIGR02757 family protein [Fulvivirga sedimenti]